MELLRKAMPLEVKDMDAKQGIFTGYFSSFGVVDSYNEIVDFGAFAKTFKEWGPAGKQRIKCAYQHDPFSMLLGKPLKLEEHSFGAYHETKVSMTSYGKDVFLLMEDGVLTEQSFSFETLQDVPAHKSPDGKRHLVEVRCYEFGPQTWGANPETPITGIKAPDLMNRMKRLDKHLKGGDLSDGSMIALLTQTMELWSKTLSELPAESDPPEPEVIEVQTTSDSQKAEPETGGSDLEKKSLNGVLSLEETIGFVWAAVRMIERIPYSDGDGDYARYWLMETYPDQAIVEDGKTGKYYSAPWVMGQNGVAVGQLTEVERTYVPVQKAKSVSSLLRIASVQTKGLETKAGARNSATDAATIRDIHRMALGLMEKPQQCKAMAEDMNGMTEDDMTVIMGLVDETHKAYVLAAIQPEPEPGTSHSKATTEETPAPGPDSVHPDETQRKRRKRELELMELESRL